MRLIEIVRGNTMRLAEDGIEIVRRREVADSMAENARDRMVLYVREIKDDWMDMEAVKEVQLPKFDNRTNENPRKFLQDFEEFLNIRGISEKWANVGFRKAIGANIKFWFEAVGERAEGYEALMTTFLQRFWNHERQVEVVRKFYNPSNYRNTSLTKEQYLLKSYNENRFLDNLLPEKNFVLAMSRHFGADLAKQVVMANIKKVDEFATMLTAWEMSRGMKK